MEEIKRILRKVETNAESILNQCWFKNHKRSNSSLGETKSKLFFLSRIVGDESQFCGAVDATSPLFSVYVADCAGTNEVRFGEYCYLPALNSGSIQKAIDSCSEMVSCSFSWDFFFLSLLLEWKSMAFKLFFLTGCPFGLPHLNHGDGFHWRLL